MNYIEMNSSPYITAGHRLNLEREMGGCVCFAVVDPNKDKKAKPGRGRFSVTANGEEKELVPANYVLDGESETK